MKRKAVIEQLIADAKAIRPDLHTSPIPGVGPNGTVDGLPDDLPPGRGVRPGAWQGVYSGYEMARAWHEGYHAATIHALHLLGEEDA